MQRAAAEQLRAGRAMPGHGRSRAPARGLGAMVLVAALHGALQAGSREPLTFTADSDGNGPRACVFRNDGRVLAWSEARMAPGGNGDASGRVHLIALGTGESRALDGEGLPGDRLCFSPDGKLIAATWTRGPLEPVGARVRGVVTWDIASGKELPFLSLDLHARGTAEIHCMGIGGADQALICYRTDTQVLTAIEPATGRALRTVGLKGALPLTGPACLPCLSDDGQVIVAEGGDHLVLIDAATFRCGSPKPIPGGLTKDPKTGRWAGKLSPVIALALSADRARVAVRRQDGTLRLLGLPNCQVEALITVPTMDPRSPMDLQSDPQPAFLPDDSRLALPHQDAVFFFDVPSGKPAGRNTESGVVVESVRYSSDAQWVALLEFALETHEERVRIAKGLTAVRMNQTKRPCLKVLPRGP